LSLLGQHHDDAWHQLGAGLPGVLL
jgi:hypothetical protein